MKDFSERVAVITGAASGIGQQLALQLAQRGAVLALADKDYRGLSETLRQVEAVGGVASLYELDVSDAAAFQAFADAVVRKHHAIHVLINNAGVTLLDSIEEQSHEDLAWLMNINFWAVVYGTKAFLPYLKKAEEAHIVNISSIFGMMAVPLHSAYNASKFAVRGYTEALAIEMTGTNVSVSCVHPGGIKTNIARNARVSHKELRHAREKVSLGFDDAAKTTSERAAKLIIRGVERRQRRVLIGLDAWLIDKIVRIFPAAYARIFRLHKLFKKIK